jgi:hypothetical protein
MQIGFEGTAPADENNAAYTAVCEHLTLQILQPLDIRSHFKASDQIQGQGIPL